MLHWLWLLLNYDMFTQFFWTPEWTIWSVGCILQKVAEILHKCLQYVTIVYLFLWVWYFVSPAFQVGRLPETGNKLRHDLQIIFQAVTVPRFHCSKVWVSLLSFWGSFEDNESSAFLEVFVNQFFYGRGIYVTDQTFRRVGPRSFLERLGQTETRTPCVRKNHWLRGHWNKKTTPIIFIA